jgi:hypothetical protein
MPRLNLDIFGDQPAKDEQSNKPEDKHASDEHSIEHPAPPPVTAAEKHTPKFVPVGFYEEHLRLLDEAVLALRRKGHWKASKSAIIRSLIDRHRDELVNHYTG